MLSFEVESGIKKAVATISKFSQVEIIENAARAEGCDLIELCADDSLTLRSAGYFLRPRKVTYKLLIPENEEQYLASLRRSKRKGIKKALALCRESGIKLFTEEPVQEETFLAWEKIYDRTISQKRLGFKRMDAKRFASIQPRTVGIFASKDGVIIGGILLQKKRFFLRGEQQHKLSISLSSSDKRFFMLGVNEALNFEAVKFCQTKGIRFLERGMDTNLYGHYLSPGLYTFKKSLGYRITARPRYGNVWTKIINFEKFSDPVFFISLGGKGIEGNLFFRETLPNHDEFQSKHLRKLNVFSVSDNHVRPFKMKLTI